VPEGGWASVVVNVTEKGTTYLAAFMVKALSLAPNDVRIYRGNALVYNAPIPWFMGPEDLKRKYWKEVVEKGYIDVYHGLAGDVGKGLDRPQDIRRDCELHRGLLLAHQPLRAQER
jgi:hypothetical protein